MALVFAFAGTFAGPARAQTGGGTEYAGVLEDSFVLFQNEQGETVCRVATPEERERVRAAAATHVIYRGAPTRRQVLDDNQEVLVPNSAQDVSGLALLPSAGLTIVLQGTAQLEANPAAKNAFIAAANRWESIISTPVTVTLSVDFGPNFFDQGAYPSPGILGQTGSFVIKSNGSDPTLATVRQHLIENSNPTAAELALYNALPASSVPADFNGATVNVSNVKVNTAQARALGFNVAAGPDAQIGFNSNFGPSGNPGQFDFDPSDGITAGYTDFDAVVVHEIGHALGFVSANGTGSSASLSVWDLFRFYPGQANAGNFGTALRVLTAGASPQVMFGGFTSTYASPELAVSTGGPSGTADGGDGRQSSHWKDDQLYSTRPFIGIMDPTLARGVRRTITENDIRTIDLLGYSVAFDPQRPVNDNFANAASLSGASGTFTGTNAWATREPGELASQLDGAQAGFFSDKSVWFNWTAPANGTATFNTAGSSFDTTLGVYTGGSVNTLGQTACFPCTNDDAGGLKTSAVQVNATAGTTYRIDVDGWNSENGTVVLNWTFTAAPTPTPTPVATPTPTPIPTPTPSPSPTPVAGRFNVVGRVADAGGRGVAGVRVGISGPTLPNGLQYPAVLTDANGNFTISALPVGATYTVAPLREGPYAFSPASRTAFSDFGQNIGLNDFVTSPGNPIDGSAAFVEQHYRDFLGRASDASGLQFWTSEIESCLGDLVCREVKRINVSAAFFQSIEFQNTGYLVERMYKTAYGDRIEGSTGLVVPVITREEFAQDTPLVGAGVVVNTAGWDAKLESNKVAYAQTFVQRQRFTDIYGALTPAQFVDRLDANAGRVLTAAERSALIDELTANDTAAGRASVLRKVAENTELDRREKNRAFVLMQYFGYLRRNPSDAPEANLNYAGWNFWLGKLDEFNGNYVQAELVKAFLDSTEYRQRFGP